MNDVDDDNNNNNFVHNYILYIDCLRWALFPASQYYTHYTELETDSFPIT